MSHRQTPSVSCAAPCVPRSAVRDRLGMRWHRCGSGRLLGDWGAENCGAGGRGEDGLGACVQPEAVPVEDHVVADDLAEAALQGALTCGGAECTPGLVECLGPVCRSCEWPVDAEQRTVRCGVGEQ